MCLTGRCILDMTLDERVVGTKCEGLGAKIPLAPKDKCVTLVRCGGRSRIVCLPRALLAPLLHVHRRKRI